MAGERRRSAGAEAGAARERRLVDELEAVRGERDRQEEGAGRARAGEAAALRRAEAAEGAAGEAERGLWEARGKVGGAIWGGVSGLLAG